MKVLIVGDGTGALAAARELGRAGWFVGIASGRRWGWGSLSRQTSRWHHVSTPSGDLNAFVEALNRATAEQGYEVLFPATDTELLALSAVREKLTARLPYAPHDCVLRGVDKLALAALARDCGFASPVTLAASEDALAELGLPVIVKSRLHWQPESPGEQTRVEAVVARTRQNALHEAEQMRAAGAEPLFQEFVAGTLLAYVVFADRGHRIAADHLRLTIHERSSETGLIARADSAPVPEGLLEKTQILAEKLEWVGLMTLQFQISGTGALYLIDFNGRMDGEYALANACGMRAMDAWARLAIGEDPALDWEVAVGPRYQAVEADLRRAAAEPGARRIPELLSALAKIFSAVHPIFCWSDPAPALSYFTRRAERILAKLTSKIRPRQPAGAKQTGK